MDLNLLTAVIRERQDVISQISIIERNYDFEENLNYVLVGLRRSGKSFLMYKRAQELVQQGISWKQIIYLNFEDERLADFKLTDFNDILIAANTITTEKHYFFFDEIQNVDGWERFARRLADQNERVFITGSNSKTLGQDIISRLGGRYMIKYVSPFSFKEYLRAKNLEFDQIALLNSKNRGEIESALSDYLRYGGLPETLNITDKRDYLNNIYQNVFLSDIIVRNRIRNPEGLALLMKKLSEAVMRDVSYTNLHHTIRTVINDFSKGSVIDYLRYSKEAYLLFGLKNYYAKFVQRESNSKYYFVDNGILNLFYLDHQSALLENLVAIYLHNKYQDDVYYLKSEKTGIDIDFFVPDDDMAIQVAWTINGSAYEREVSNLVNFVKKENSAKKLVIVTRAEEKEITVEDVKISIVPLAKFLLG